MNEVFTIPTVVQSAFNNVDPGQAYVQFRFNKRTEWKVLFDFYNQHNEKELSTNCMPCFLKVYMWIKNRISA